VNRTDINDYSADVHATDIFGVRVTAEGIQILGVKPYLLARLSFIQKAVMPSYVP
jgi:hypothetical protein